MCVGFILTSCSWSGVALRHRTRCQVLSIRGEAPAPRRNHIFPPSPLYLDIKLTFYYNKPRDGDNIIQVIMLPTTIRSTPSVGDYTPLDEYESQTPESFVGGKPVLHYHIVGAKAWLPKTQCGNLAIFPADASEAPTGPEADQINREGEQLVEQKVDVFVNSEYVSRYLHLRCSSSS